MKKLAILFILLPFLSMSQSVEITPGNILPKMTTSQRTDLSGAKDGMLVFDSTTQSYWYRQSGSWVELPKGGSTSNYWKLEGAAGNEIKNTNSGGFWSANPTTVMWYNEPPPNAPASGDGTRLMWIPSRSAFRVGTIDNNSKLWDKDSIGVFSFAVGLNTLASSRYSVAIGGYTTASGKWSTAMGGHTTASGEASTAMGFVTTASGVYSTAMGSNTTASGSNSTAMGADTEASGDRSIAMGYKTKAKGSHSLAAGYESEAGGEYAIAMGHESNAEARNSTVIGKNITLTTGATGSMYLADAASSRTSKDSRATANHFYARFSGGYNFYTQATGTVGPSLSPGQTSWGVPSDSTLKENFIPANTENVLNSVSQMRIGTWNYKEQDPAQFRHWGVMAQDFYKYFGKDEFGTIGNDKSIATADFDGVAFAAIKGLEQRTRDLKSENENLKMKNEGQEKTIAELLTEIKELKKDRELFASEIFLIKQQLGLNAPESRMSEE